MPRRLYLVLKLDDPLGDASPSALQDIVESMDLAPGMRLAEYTFWEDDRVVVKGNGYRT